MGDSAARILVVDDELGFRELMSFELSSRGYRVTTAANGDEAVQKAGAADIDVVISDLTMPKRGGLDTLDALKDIDPTMEVIMVTGYATLQSAVESMKQGAYDFITKPFQIGDLVRIVERASDKCRLNRKVRELQESARVQSEYRTVMSHELRAPLNTILGYTVLHLERTFGEITAKQEEYLRKVEAAGKDMLRLIDSTPDLSKTSRDRRPVCLEEFGLGDLGRDLARTLEPLARSKGLSLEWSVPEDLRMRSDKGKLKRILHQLVTNAIQFTSTGGVRVEASPAPEGGRAHIRIRDTGAGIAPEKIPRLLRGFEAGETASIQELAGMGSGLVMSRTLAELLGGSILVESEEGVGTLVTVSLPLRGLAPS